MQILVATLGLIAFAIDKLNILPVLKTSAMIPSFRGLVAIIIGFFVALFFFCKLRCGAGISILVAVAVVAVVSGLIFVESVAVVMIASFFCLYIVFAFFALCITYGCLLNLEKYFECQAETKDCEIRKLQSNTDREREDIETKRQECENNEKKARENYEEGKGKLSYCLLVTMISVMVCVLCSVIYKINVLEHKSEKKMTNDQNSNMECLGLTIENPKPKDSKDDTKK